MRFLLDTNAVISLLGNKSAALRERVMACLAGDIVLSSVVAHELYFGAFRSQKVAHNLETLRLLFKDFEILDFNSDDARQAGEIRAGLARQGTPIGSYDVLIAAQAQVRQLTLITNNLGAFERVAGLSVQDWTINIAGQ